MIPMLREVFIMIYLEPGVDHRITALIGSLQVREAVASFDLVSDAKMLTVVGIIIWCHDPLAQTKDSPGLEHPRYSCVYFSQTRCVDCGLDGVSCIETFGREVLVKFQEVPFCECA